MYKKKWICEMHKKIKKVSIRIKILQLALNPLIFLSLILGFSSVILVNRLAKEDAKNLMVQVCEKETARFDNKLNLVKQSVSIIDDYIKKILRLGNLRFLVKILKKQFENFQFLFLIKQQGLELFIFATIRKLLEPEQVVSFI